LRRSGIALFVAAGVLAVPASAAARPLQASVLRLDRKHHTVRVVTANHAVRSFHYSGKLGKRVKPGSRITADARGRTLRRVKPRGRVRVLKFYGRVVSDGRRGLVLRLGDGKRLTLGGGTPGHAAVRAASADHPISISIQGLQPGQTVLVTIAFDSSGGETITIQITVSTGDGSGDPVDNGDGGQIDDNNGEDYTVDGTVTAVDPGAGTLEIDTADGHLVFTADPEDLDGLSVGDTVEIDYAKDTSTGDLIADDVFPIDPGAGSGDNSGDGSGSGSGDNSGDGSGSGSGDNSGGGSGDSSGGGSGDNSGGGSGDSSGGGSGDSSGGGGSGGDLGGLLGNLFGD
jgi:hypothetical protein